jgi:hypothetical protein
MLASYGACHEAIHLLWIYKLYWDTKIYVDWAPGLTSQRMDSYGFLKIICIWED